MKDFYCKRHHTLARPLFAHSATHSYIEEMRPHQHPSEIRDLNEGVSTKKMDRSQLMCFLFFYFYHAVELALLLNLGSPRTGRVMNPERKAPSMFIFFFSQRHPLSQTHIPSLDPQLIAGLKAPSQFHKHVLRPLFIYRCVHRRAKEYLYLV